MTASVSETLPHWDMTVVYPALDAPEFNRDLVAVRQAFDDMTALFDRLGIDRRDDQATDNTALAAFDTVIAALNDLLERFTTLRAYVYSFVATDSRDDRAQAALSLLMQDSVKLTKLSKRLTAWIGGLDAETLIQRSAVARDHAYLVRRAVEEARHLMSPAEEELAAELDLSGGIAWTRLYQNLTSQMMVPIERDGQVVELPMSQVRNLARDPSREVRRHAHEAELAAWERAALPIAAALNSIKGQVLALGRRRCWATPLDASLFDNGIDRATLDAMMHASREFFPDFRRYLRAKARLLGVERLAWYDLFAPVGGGGRSWQFSDAEAFIVAQFARYSPRMGEFAARAFRERWIDAEPRAGKVGGAFCMSLRRDESRILVNHDSTADSMFTLAHELGHAYHNLNLAHQTMLNRDTPMTLAETASIFCETIVRNAALQEATRDETLEILEAFLSGACQVVVDITSRFLFETALFEQRAARDLSVAELCTMMTDAQKQTYGDVLDEQTLHPFMWAVKGHYYSSGFSYYNYPYMFGLLFGLGLYAEYQRAPEAFQAHYDGLLASTGLASPLDLAARLGFDLRAPAFWRASLEVVRKDIDRFEALVDVV
ncbi:M3 family oligoendopeptidase [Roseiflexus castenholzii]|uniref:Oligoendopeptidase, pepF/M3 family n=1 Tax=Roseiflexus castenholzii (strain DSM 13941 / HLO8) TaxID=383372 RepID=A7NP28_ROSCS|nr:M3 family oligoendopeptidase [Roseiflexus castenholzii]ABU59324.1 oligoendopeptidase, pepF/M3 family [Roseiflexus castenholzii DSM 13941]